MLFIAFACRSLKGKHRKETGISFGYQAVVLNRAVLFFVV